MNNQQQFDLNIPNIFMRLFFNDHNSDEETSITFVYSDINGFNYLKKQLNENELFNGLLNEKEVLKKMSDKLSSSFSYNNNISLESSEWSGALIIPYSKKGKILLDEFAIWKTQLEKLVGKDNLFQVTIPEIEFDNFRMTIKDGTPEKERDQEIFNYINIYRLQLELNEILSVNTISERKHKI